MTESTNTTTSGVNREQAESIIEKFLGNGNYRVLAVTGKWGVGKTHLVQTFLDKHKKNYYLYASVFGISSIEQLKARLIVNYKGKESKNFIAKNLANVVDFASRNAPKAEKFSKLLDLKFSKESSISVAGSLLSIAGDLGLEILFNLNFLDDSIICIDDLERKSKLPLDELLGFVEYLVQEFKCKIILIYNEDTLLKNEDNKKVLEDYQEKLIDKKFKFDPTVEDNLNVGLEDKPDLEAHDLEIIKNVFLRSRTNNIRVIKKTKWLINEIIPLMKDWENTLRHQIIRNAIIINLAKLDTEFCKKFPNIKDIKSTLSKDPSEYVGTDQKANDLVRFQLATDKIKAIGRTQFLNQYLGYSPLEQLDEFIIQLVETPFSKSAELEFSKKGEILNQREQKNQIVKKIRSLGQISYYSSFADNEEEIVNEIISFLKDHHLDLSISQFEQIQRFTSILEVDISHYEKALLEKLLTENLGLDSYNDLSIIRNKLSKYPVLEAFLKDKINDYHQSLDITTALKKIINTESQSS